MKDANVLYQIPPNDPELEKQVLGTLLLYPDYLDEFTLKDEKIFYSADHRKIFKYILAMKEKEIPISPDTLYTLLKEDSSDLSVNIITELTNKAVAKAVFDYQLKKLAEYQKKRQIQRLLIQTQENLSEGVELDELKEELLTSLGKIKVGEEIEKPISWGELLKKDLPSTPYWIGKGLLPKQGFTMIAGRAKEGKTMLALNFALCLAEGMPVFMRKEEKEGLFPVPEKAKTLFLFRENTESTLREIITKQMLGLQNLTNKNIADETLNSIKFLRPKKVYLDMKPGQQQLEKIIKNNPTNVVVIDPLSRFISKDMNKMEEVIGIANFLDSLNEKYGCAFLLLHHFRKSGTGGETEEDPFERITGSAGWRNCLASCIAMEKKSERRSRNIKKLSFEFRNEESPEPKSILRNSDTLLFEMITEEEVLEGTSSVSKLVELMQKEFKNGAVHTVICEIAAKEFGVKKQRINELLVKGKKNGVIGKEKGRTGKWFVISQGKLSL